MKHALLAALLLFPLPAFAQEALTVSVGGVTETWSLSPADQQSFEQWVQSAYKCTDGPNCTPLTLAQSEGLWAQATLQGTLDNVTRYHKAQAAIDAAAGVPPITPVSKTARAKK